MVVGPEPGSDISPPSSYPSRPRPPQLEQHTTAINREYVQGEEDAGRQIVASLSLKSVDELKGLMHPADGALAARLWLLRLDADVSCA